jgi:hypothetical protein
MAKIAFYLQRIAIFAFFNYWNGDGLAENCNRETTSHFSLLYYKYNTEIQRYRETEKNTNSISLCLYVESDIRCIILSVAQFVTKEDKR